MIILDDLLVHATSKRLKLAKEARRTFLESRAFVMDGPIQVYGTARSKKDLSSWDFNYQKDRWLAENQELVTEYLNAHQFNLELSKRALAEIELQFASTEESIGLLRRTEQKKVAKVLRGIDWPQELVLHLHANYTSPAGRINLNDSQVYRYSLESSGIGIADLSTAASVPRTFEDPQKLQFPGVYVYSYPSLMEGREVFPVKIGKSESSVYSRVRQQISQGGAAIPEDPFIICAVRIDNGAGTAEAKLHSTFRAHRTQGGGTEWFSISLQQLRNELTARKYSSTWNSKLSA